MSFSLIISVFSALVFYATRFTWSVTDFGTGFENICTVLFCVMIFSALFSAVLLFLRLYKIKVKGKVLCDTRGYGIASVSAIAIAAFSLCVAVYSAYRMVSYESHFVMWLYFKEALLYVVIALIPTLAVLLPAIGRKTQIRLICIILAVSLVAGAVSMIPHISYKIVSDPMVIDNGSSYSIVFATNDEGTGYVEYTYNGKEYKVFDSSYGKLACDSKIHSISVPYEHIRNNQYRVGSTNIIEEFSYGSIKGKTAVSRQYLFTYEETKEAELLVLSDWHTHTDKVYEAAECAGGYDAIVLMGDSSPGVDFEEEVVKYTVEVAGKLSGGVKPIIYLRGNHETRGAYADELGAALGLESFYYTAQMGGCTFVVLDSGEDEESFCAENGGLTEGVQYFRGMATWLENSEITTDKVIALSHSWKICDIDKALSEEFHKALNRRGVSLLLSGHSHENRLIGTGDEDERTFTETYPEIRGYMCGGINSDAYVISKLSLSDESFTLEAYDNSGKKTFDNSFEW